MKSTDNNEATFTTLIERTVDSYDSYDAIEDAVEFLENPKSFRAFDEGLIDLLKRNGYSKSLDNRLEMAEYLIQRLNKINSKVTKATVFSWFDGKHRPKVEAGYRKNMYEICFALNLKLNEVIWFFHHVYYDRAFNFHIIDEAVFYYAFSNGLSYEKANVIINEVNDTRADEAVDYSPPNYSQLNYTKFVKTRIEDFTSEEQLMKFLIANKSNFEKWNESALKELQKMYERLVCSDSAKKDIVSLRKRLSQSINITMNTDISIAHYEECGLILKEIFFDAKNNGDTLNPPAMIFLENVHGVNLQTNTFILNYIVNMSSGLSKDTRDIPMLVRTNFPSKKVLSDLLTTNKIERSKSYDSIRKTIILLNFYSFWVSIKIDEESFSKLTSAELRDIYIAETNSLLYNCGYESLYAGNPYDWIFLRSASSEEPLTFFREFFGEIIPD